MMNLNELFQCMKKALNPEQPVHQPAPVHNPESNYKRPQESAPEQDERFLLARTKCIMAKIMMKTCRQA